MNITLIIGIVIIIILCILLKSIFFHLFLIIITIFNKNLALSILYKHYDKKLISYKKTLNFAKENKKDLIKTLGKENYNKRMKILKNNIKIINNIHKKILDRIPWK